jgi:hypothetical protein
LLAAGLLMSIGQAAGMDAGVDLVWIRRHSGDVGLLMGRTAAAHFSSPFLFCFPFFTLHILLKSATIPKLLIRLNCIHGLNAKQDLTTRLAFNVYVIIAN